MSEVISFRLDPKNPREAEALQVLTCQQEQGYSVRHILTEALLRFEQAESEEEVHSQITELMAAISRISAQLEQQVRIEGRVMAPSEAQPASLSDAFMLAVKSVARPGLALEG